MWVYGDHAREVAPREALAALADTLAALPSGPDRPGALADAFVDASALAQALIDAAFDARGGVDARSPLADALMAALTGLARALLGEAAADPAPWRSLAPRVPPGPVCARLAEGHAFYALHPLAYARAARAAGLGPDARVIGLRSIGTGLACVAAAAVGAPPPVTVRPTGPPFARRLSLAPALHDELAAAPGPVAVVDEGPGLSGSSFLAAADALAEAGVGRERLVLLPSHDHGPGAEAPPAARDLWRTARRATAEPDLVRELSSAFADLTGPATAPLRDVSGGAWRRQAYAAEADWPAVDTFGERRKFRLDAERGPCLVKWAGLGADARAKLGRGRALSEAGLCPPVTALRDGWLLRPWAEGRPLGTADAAPLEALARALALRAGLDAPGVGGASAADLAEMTRVNVTEALGAAVGARASERVARGLAGAPPPRVWIDGRLHRHEWLRTPDGRTLKTDALDHARAHDLIGAQEVGWDVAGAAVEWDLAPAEVAALARSAGAPADRLPALETAYSAFQLGAAASAAASHGHDPAERGRLRRGQDRYARRLARTLRYES